MSKTSVLVTVTLVTSVTIGGVSGLLPMSVEGVSGLSECPHHCPTHYSPVCGTDNRYGGHAETVSQSEGSIDQSEARHDIPRPRDYDNVCKMLQSACHTRADVSLAHVGRCGVPEPCPSFCPLEGELSFCGDDGVTYPRRGHCDVTNLLIHLRCHSEEPQQK